MAQEEGNIATLSQAVYHEVQGETDKILSDARTEAAEIMQRAQEQATGERQHILDHAALEADRIRRQASASAQLFARTMRMKRREKLLDDVFDAAQEQIPTVLQWSEYGGLSQALLREALTRLGAQEAIVHADEATGKLLAGGILAQTAKETGADLRAGEPLERGTGIVVETTDRHQRYDNTLETRLSRMRSGLRAHLYHILTGGAL